MTREEVQSMLQLADLHVLRIEQALEDVKALFPLDTDKVKQFDKNTIFAIEVLTSRFSKLQDYLGAVVFDALFAVETENTETWTMIDKINKLEKYGIIADAHIWRDMRKSRNFLIHEYPDQPEVIAASLNVIYDFVPVLLDIKNKLFARLLLDA